MTLSNGRKVPNPLATTYRFAYGTRGEGQVKTPTQVGWNLKLQRDFAVGPSKIQLSLDVFNLTNSGADQQFLDGGNVLTSANYAMKNGTWQGQARQAPRVFQISARFQF